MRQAGLKPVLLLALSLAAGLLLARTVAAQSTAAYLRIDVAPTTTLYVKFQSAEVRMATTVKALTRAKPIRLYQAGDMEIEFPEVDLPVPLQTVPAGFSKLRGCFVVYAPSRGPATGEDRPANYVYGHLAFPKKDKNGGTWKYLLKFRSKTGANPETAPVVPMEPPKEIKLNLTAQSNGREIGIIITATAGHWSATTRRWDILDFLMPDGSGAPVRVRVLDAKGKVVSSESQAIGMFGSNEGDPEYTVPIKAPGIYTCEATMDGGPLAPMLKAVQKVRID